MKIIKLNAINSTNTYLKEILKKENVQDNTVVWTQNQTEGRGQQDAKWVSEPYKNLTFSILKRFDDFLSEHHFVLNMVVALSIFRCLKKLHIPDLSLKWANDILSGNKKICGILIENSINNQYITTSVIGVGLNVNQLNFNELTKATSLQKITGIHYNLEEIIHLVLKELQVAFQKLYETTPTEIYNHYHKYLYRKDKPSTFQDIYGMRFMGFIRGVTAQGELCIELEDQVLRTFRLKEVQLLY
ncbi:biotin--[acetyl-CoA-carboxylase] ligase [Capnocytophaga catalasegens]|uniref:Biotin--[acetyl-CoA-carboxylase] ligase n=1 Tax=Capnocytophaga catalasegens TaxID=1004260 RepID=A0AAV5AUV0_9FLAO|nr:biotin--[acetyl-CoA-carboxylase] ligase [Capnocytophaga catalasegens]GIZ16457.1 biotin--[acetyl-CoA-carboxylase] ligase [Capnocytophaga catalasegens]GJM50304.1 biotin--[acetyl-CoA-carboxylase] ligase [Capnocytophaga catalasegens]GJM53821.1 biotin--[acetyl-CoA-carboxylase] ligase [Capnocytophaga catalasegens]